MAALGRTQLPFLLPPANRTPCPADAQRCWLCFPLLLKTGLLWALEGSGFQVETFRWEGQCTGNPCRKLTLGRSSFARGQAENPRCYLGSLPQAWSLILS